MNYIKSYYKTYDNNDNNDNDYNDYNDYDDYDMKKNIKNFDFIIEKTNNNLNPISQPNLTNMILLQNKVEELFLKLKFANSNKKISTFIIPEYIDNEPNDLDSNNLVSNDLDSNDLVPDNLIPNILIPDELIHNSKFMINFIDKIIINLDKKIISKGQIIRKNNFIDFEF